MLGRLIALSCLVGAANGLFFHIKQGEVKCFVEEVPDETLVSGKTVPLFFFNTSVVRAQSHCNVLSSLLQAFEPVLCTFDHTEVC